MLLPAETLLDLYGEDIRARAYVTHDPDRGEMNAAPRFHRAGGADAHGKRCPTPPATPIWARCFRTQRAGSGRPSEYLQVGYELFQRDDPVSADAEVFALFSEVLSPAGLRAVTGDIGILLAAIDSLTTTDARKAALRRHVWRPRRFRALIDRYTGRAPVPPARAALIGALASRDAAALIAEGGPEIGLRTAEEVVCAPCRAGRGCRRAAHPRRRGRGAGRDPVAQGRAARRLRATARLPASTCRASPPRSRPSPRASRRWRSGNRRGRPALRGQLRTHDDGVLRRVRLRLPRREGAPICRPWPAAGAMTR